MICRMGLFACTIRKQISHIEATFALTRYAEKQNSGMGLVKTRRLAAMHPPSPRLRKTRKQQRAKAAMKLPMNGGGRKACSRQFPFGERKHGK